MNASRVPLQPKIYHIVHVDRLRSIVAHGGLLSDGLVQSNRLPGTTVGMSRIKQRRLSELKLLSHPNLHVGECVPFYFCPRSVMLYVIHQGHQQMSYRGGQTPIIHFEADLQATVAWAEGQSMRWAFTFSNAGSFYFEDTNELSRLGEINWQAIHAKHWAGALKEGKQAEFLLERWFPWHLIDRIGVHTSTVHDQVIEECKVLWHRPSVEVRPDWYY